MLPEGSRGPWERGGYVDYGDCFREGSGIRFELMIESFGKKVGSRKRNSTVHLSSFIMNENCNHQILKKKLRGNLF